MGGPQSDIPRTCCVEWGSTRLVGQFITALSQWGLLGIALMYFLEAGGFPWPIEIPFWLSGEALNAGAHTYGEMVIFTWLGALLGSVFTLTLSRVGGRRLVRLLPLGRFRERAARTRAWVRRYGLGALVITRWTNWGIAPTLWLIGLAPVSLGRAVLVAAMNDLAWAFVWVWLARVLVHAAYGAGLPGWLVAVPGLAVAVIVGARQLWVRRRVRRV